jgi:hypothetical protein
MLSVGAASIVASSDEAAMAATQKTTLASARRRIEMLARQLATDSPAAATALGRAAIDALAAGMEALASANGGDKHAAASAPKFVNAVKAQQGPPATAAPPPQQQQQAAGGSSISEYGDGAPFMSTLAKCYHDLEWCWREAGLRGSLEAELLNAAFARLDAANDTSSDGNSGSGNGTDSSGASFGPQQLADAVGRWAEGGGGRVIGSGIGVGSSGSIGGGGGSATADAYLEALLYAAVAGLYDAAAANAAAAVARAYADTAVRLALLLSPVVRGTKCFFCL